MLLFFLTLTLSWAAPLDEIWQIETNRGDPARLAKYLSSESKDIRLAAIRALGNLRNPKSLKLLKDVKTAPNQEIRTALIQSLMMTPGSADHAMKMLNTEQKINTRASLFLTIGKQGSKKHLQPLHEALLTERVLNPKEDAIAAAIAIGIMSSRGEKNSKPSLEALVRHLRSWNVKMRRAVAFSISTLDISKTSQQRQTQLLEALHRESDPETKAKLIWATRRMKKQLEVSIPKFFMDASPQVRISTIKSYPEHSDAANLLTDKDYHVRLVAIEQLSRKGLPMKEVIRNGATITAQEEATIGNDTSMSEAVIAIKNSKIGEFSPFPLLAYSRPTAIRSAAVTLVEDTKSLLTFALTDKEAIVRRTAAETLLRRSTKQIHIKKLLGSKDKNLSKIAATELKRYPRSDMENLLWNKFVHATSNEEALVYIEAIAALEKSGRAKAKKTRIKPLLKPWWNHENHRFRVALRTIAKARRFDVPDLISDNRWQIPKEVNNIRGAIIQTNRGEIRLKLRPDIAPITVVNFARLAESDFYKGLSFDRIIPNFVVQTKPGINEREDTRTPDEPSKTPFTAGMVGMALRVTRSKNNKKKTTQFDSGGRHFFITLSDQPHLIGRYTHFADVVQGLSLLRKLRPEDKIIQVVIERTSE